MDRFTGSRRLVPTVPLIVLVGWSVFDIADIPRGIGSRLIIRGVLYTGLVAAIVNLSNLSRAS